MPGKLGMKTAHRGSVLRNQASALLWHGRIETTQGKAKQLKSYVEKIITTAIRAYEDTITVTKVAKNVKFVDKKGNETFKDVSREVVNDGAKKLAARRKVISKLHDLQEIQSRDENRSQFKARIADVKHPLIEKLFNEIAPKYAERAKELGQGGGYTRVILLGQRRGDAAETAIIELV